LHKLKANNYSKPSSNASAELRAPLRGVPPPRLPGALTYADLDIIPGKITEGTAMEPIRYSRRASAAAAAAAAARVTRAPP
jgi:hypothetical protein